MDLCTNFNAIMNCMLLCTCGQLWDLSRYHMCIHTTQWGVVAATHFYPILCCMAMVFSCNNLCETHHNTTATGVLTHTTFGGTRMTVNLIQYNITGEHVDGSTNCCVRTCELGLVMLVHAELVQCPSIGYHADYRLSVDRQHWYKPIGCHANHAELVGIQTSLIRYNITTCPHSASNEHVCTK